MILQIPPDYIGDTTKRLAAHLEDIALHPQFGVLRPQPSQLGPLVTIHTRTLPASDLVLLHPVSQGSRVDPQVSPT
jgi:hypothetical protein